MKILIYLQLSIVSLFLFSCVEDESEDVEYDIAVVESFIYPGDSIHVELSRLIPFGGDVIDTFLIEKQIELSVNDKVYVLNELDDSGNYNITLDQELTEGDVLSISFDYNNVEVKAETVVPTKPEGFQISDTEYFITQISDDLLTSGFTFERPDPLELEWENPNSEYYYLKIENLEDNPTRTNTILEDDPEKYTVFEPSQRSEANINSFSFGYYGTHRIVLYHINEEFTGLYETVGENSLSLSDPVTNVVNGLGIFTAFHSDTLYVEVKKL